VFCRRQLAGLQDVVPQLRERGASIVGISVDDPQESVLLRAMLKLEFPLLSDDAGTVANAYGVLMAREEIAIPSVFVIAPTGAIAWRHVGETVPDRPTPQSVLEAIDGMSRRGRGADKRGARGHTAAKSP
jgi:peroxiredoxin Q/BCP